MRGSPVPSSVRLRIEGPEAVDETEDPASPGSPRALRLTTAVGEMVLVLPILEGAPSGRKTALEEADPGAFVVTAPFSPLRAEGFPAALQDDPSHLLYSTFVGGSSVDFGAALVLDGAENAVVVGETWSSDFPTTPGAYDTGHNGGDYDVFVLKLAAGGGSLLYGCFVGGTGKERGYALTLDGAGNAVVTGWTDSHDFPTTSGSHDTSHHGGDYDVFVLKLAAGGGWVTRWGSAFDSRGCRFCLGGCGAPLPSRRTGEMTRIGHAASSTRGRRLAALTCQPWVNWPTTRWELV